MTWYRFYKIKNRNRVYWLSTIELGEAFALYLNGRRYQSVRENIDREIKRFIATDYGLEANIDGRDENKTYNYLREVFDLWELGKFSYLFLPYSKRQSPRGGDEVGVN